MHKLLKTLFPTPPGMTDEQNYIMIGQFLSLVGLGLLVLAILFIGAVL